MNGKHINVAGLKASVIRHKVLCVIMALALLTLMIPSGLRAHAETQNNPQPQQEEQVQPQDESATGGETEEIVNPSEKAEPAATEPSEEASQSSENAPVSYNFTAIFNDEEHKDWAKFYSFDGTPIDSVLVDETAKIEYFNSYIRITDGETKLLIFYGDIKEGYEPASGSIPPWKLIETEKPGVFKIALVLQYASTKTYTLSGTSHTGDIDCKFYDNGTELKDASFKTTSNVKISEDKKQITYTENDVNHSITAGNVDGYTFAEWQKVEDEDSFEAFYKVNGGDYTIFLHCTCDGDDWRATVDTYTLDDKEDIPARTGQPVKFYSSVEPQVKNDKILFKDFNGVEHYIKVKTIWENDPEKHHIHMIFGRWTTSPDIEESSFNAWCHLTDSAQLSGTVVENDTNSAVDNAPVAFIANNKWGISNHITTTNNEGKFSLWVPKEATGNLVISKMGYKPLIKPFTEPITENQDLGQITVEEEDLVDVTVKAVNEDEHMGFIWVQQIGDIILPLDADVVVETSLPHETSYKVDENGILTASYINEEYDINIAALLVPIAAPGYEFAHYQKNGQEILEPGEGYIISEGETELNLTVSYQEDQDAITATLSSDDVEEHDSFDYCFYINDEIIDGEEGLYDLEGTIYPGTNLYLDEYGTLYAYNYLEELDLEWGYEIISNPAEWGYEVDYFDIYIDGVPTILEPGTEITIDEGTKEVDGVVHYKEMEYAPDVYLTVEPANPEQHEGFDWATYVDDEVIDYGEDVYGYEGPAYSHTELTVEEDGTVTSYHYNEDLDVTWGISIAPNAAEGYEFDYYEVWVNDEAVKLTPGTYEIPEVDEIYATVNYKEVSPSPEPQPTPDKGDKSKAAKISPKTGDAMPFALVGGIAILAMASAGYVLSRKLNK